MKDNNQLDCVLCSDTGYVNVVVAVPLTTLFTYRVPRSLRGQLTRGKRVLVPFGRKQIIGICWDVMTTLPASVPQKQQIKDILTVLDEQPLVDAAYLQWLEFAADYYATPLGQVLSQAIPSLYLDVQKIGKEHSYKYKPINFSHDFSTKDVVLTNEQNLVYQSLAGHLDEYYPVLLRGVTGSGKTEVYIRVIKTVLQQNKSALFLVPEIGLTPQMLARLNHHFAGSLLVYHSSLTQNQRLSQWQSCLDERPQVLVGTRSALFAPFKNLGVIIVDEEHDHSYKQEERFRYQARNLAVSRARILKIPVIMGSATPSLETYYQVINNKYHLYELHARSGGASLPDIRVIHFGKEREQRKTPLCLSQHIHDAIEHFHKKKKQMLIYVGQRGFAQSAYCASCATIQICPNCSVGLKYHKEGRVLKCHYCDFAKPYDGVCAACHVKGLTLLGFGTQSVADEIGAMHPRVVLTRLDSDAVSNERELRRIFNDFAKHKIDLIVGTQMISKGHDFDNIGFVGILGIDAHLGLPDFRASERSFQNLVQVAGRAGRSDQKGHVLVQSLMPEHPSVQWGIRQDYQKFAQHELALRQALGYPPFSRLVQFRFLSAQEQRLKNFLCEWKTFLDGVTCRTNQLDLQILGPAEMPVAKVRGKYRHHVILKIRRGLKVGDLVAYLRDDLDRRKLRGIQYQIDVDAVGMV
ncbi:MAG: hypothetical protein ACD_62C00210G0003 [uncultured bacterium]|nr:MAG: hypothetical protein ACD_62C00210G0003 [uncultured bacterium]